jgi:hypothetical protein
MTCLLKSRAKKAETGLYSQLIGSAVIKAHGLAVCAAKLHYVNGFRTCHFSLHAAQQSSIYYPFLLLLVVVKPLLPVENSVENVEYNLYILAFHMNYVKFRRRKLSHYTVFSKILFIL